jgi:hypothetical protein
LYNLRVYNWRERKEREGERERTRIKEYERRREEAYAYRMLVPPIQSHIGRENSHKFRGHTAQHMLLDAFKISSEYHYSPL